MITKISARRIMDIKITPEATTIKAISTIPQTTTNTLTFSVVWQCCRRVNNERFLISNLLH